MQRNTLITIGLIVLAALVIASMFFYEPVQVVDNTNAPGTTTQPGTTGGSGGVQTPGGGTGTTTRPGLVTFRVLDTGTNASSIASRRNMTARTQAELRELWTAAKGTDSTPPTINFSREYVIAVFAGQKSSGGHGVEVASVVDTSTARTVSVRIVKPGDGCIVTQALTNPYQIIVVPLSSAPIVYEDAQVIRTCD